MPVAYDSMAPGYARHRVGQKFVVDVLHRLHGKSPGGPVLEVGCGTGDYATTIAESGSCMVYAMDPSRQMLLHAPERHRLVYLQGRAACLPFTDATLDMVFSVNVVHHLEPIGQYFRESFRVLRRGGILCTATDSEAMIRRRKPLSHYWPSTVPVDLGRYHGLATLRAEMEATGFRRIDACEGRSDFSVPDIGPYRDKAFSCLELIPEEDFERGLAAMQADLRAGPMKGASEQVFLWGERT